MLGKQQSANQGRSSPTTTTDHSHKFGHGMSVEDFSASPTSSSQDATAKEAATALMESKVRRNLDKPCRTVPVPTSSHSAVKEMVGASSEISAAPSDPMNNRRFANFEDGPKENNFGAEENPHDPCKDISDGDFTNRDAPTSQPLEMPSPSASCNASQIMMKSLMKSYNAGNVQFYENLHRKYFDKAKGNKDPRNVDPPSQLLDMTADGDVTSRAGEELSRFMADSRLNDGSRSRSRSRGNGFSNKYKNGVGGHEGFHTTSNNVLELDQTQGGHTVALDDTHLFELTEKSNNTYMAYSYFNNTSNTGQVPNRPMAGTQEPNSIEPFGKQGEMISEINDRETHSKLDAESSSNAMSINFKNSIYSKIKYDPSVHNLAPSMISARHMPMHSDASASQISTMNLTSKMLGRNGVITYRNGGSVEDAESEVPTNYFLTRQKLLSSSSSPEIDLEEVMRRQQPQRSRLGSNSRGNKSVPNIREVVDVVSKRYGIYDGDHHQQRDEMSRRDLSARIEEDGDRVTNFELGSQNTRRSNEQSPRNDDPAHHSDPQHLGDHLVQRNHGQLQMRQTDFSEKVQNLMSPENLQFADQKIKMPQTQQNIQPDDTSSSFLRQLQGLGSPDSTSNQSYPPSHLHKQHHFLQTDNFNGQYINAETSTEKQHHLTSGTSTTKIAAEPQTLTQEALTTDNLTAPGGESAPVQRTKDDLPMQPKPKDSSLLQTFQEQVRLARQRNQSTNATTPGVTPGSQSQPSSNQHVNKELLNREPRGREPLSTDQQAQMIKQQFDSVPTMPKNQLLKDKLRQFTSQKDQQHPQHQQETSQHHQNSISNLDGEGHRSDFTFVLSQPTQGGFTECHNCGAANGSILLDNNINGSILQSQGLRSSIGDTSMQIRKKVLTNFYSNGMPIPPGQNNNQCPHGGTASFPDGILNGGGGNPAINTSITNFQSAQSSEQRANRPQDQAIAVQQKSGGLRNRLPEIAASPIYSESGGAPGRKFFMSLNQQANANQPQFSVNNNRAGVETTTTEIQRKQNQLIFHNTEQLRLSQIQEDGGLQVQTPPDAPRLHNHQQQQPQQQQQHQNFMQSPQRQSHEEMGSEEDMQGNCQQEQSPDPQNLHELFAHQQMELNHARSLLICSYDHLQRLMQQGWTRETQEEALRLMQVIQGTTLLSEQQFGGGQSSQIMMAASYGQIPEAIENEEEEEEMTVLGGVQQHHHGIVREDEQSQQMTDSEFQDGDSQNVDKVFLMPKQVVHNQQQSSRHDLTERNEQLNHLEVKHLQTRSGPPNLKNSLLSSAAVQDNTLYDLDKDTVYSFFAEESEIVPRGRQLHYHNQNQQQHHQQRLPADEQTSFIASRSPRENRRKSRSPNTMMGDELDPLTQTKTQLKTERRINQAQADMLTKMQAQIDHLSQKWSITETQLRNNGAIYSAMWQPGSTPFNNASNVWHPTATTTTNNPRGAFYSVLGTNTQQLQQPPKQATLSELVVAANSNIGAATSPSMLDGGTPTPNQKQSHAFSSPFQHQQQQVQVQQQQAPHHQTSQSTHSHSLNRADSSGLTTVESQSKHLIEMNQQLSRQIENNMSMLESIQEVKSQQLHQQNSIQSIDQAAAPQQVLVQPPQQPHQEAASQETMQSLITLTKITAEASLQAHNQHNEEMDKLRKRQQAFSAKIEKIGSQLTSVGRVTSQQTKVGLKPSISRASSKGKNTLENNNTGVEEGDGNTSSTFIDFSDDKVPTKE